MINKTIASFIFIIFFAFTAKTENRIWTAIDGKKIKAEYIETTNDIVKLISGKTEIFIKEQALCEIDQNYIQHLNYIRSLKNPMNQRNELLERALDPENIAKNIEIENQKKKALEESENLKKIQEEQRLEDFINYACQEKELINEKSGVGFVGYFSNPIKINQVFENFLLITAEFQFDRTTFILEGVNTKNLVDDQIIEIGNLMKIEKTQSYQTVLGAKRTVYSLRFANEEEINIHNSLMKKFRNKLREEKRQN